MYIQFVRMYVCTYVHMYVCMYICTYIRTYVHPQPGNSAHMRNSDCENAIILCNNYIKFGVGTGLIVFILEL